MLFKVTLLLSSLCFAPVVIAAFSTYSADWPDDAAVVDEKITTLAPPPTTVDSVVAQALGQEAEAEVIAQRETENDRLYVKFGLNRSLIEIRHIRNKSYLPLANYPTNSYSIKKNEVSWECGLGTRVNNTRFEAEYLHHRKLNYNPAPVFIGRAEILTSEVVNRALLVNAYWDFNNVVYFKPYVGVLTGVVWNKTRSSMRGGVGTGTARTNANYGLAWGLTLGARMPFWSKWSAYFAYRYTAQSKMLWKDSTQILKLEGQYLFTGFCLGLNYIL